MCIRDRYAGMPDLTMARIVHADGSPGPGLQEIAVAHTASERVRLELRQPGSILAQLADGTAKLAVGAAAEIRP